jgi:hypothetical protein
MNWDAPGMLTTRELIAELATEPAGTARWRDLNAEAWERATIYRSLNLPRVPYYTSLVAG